nr:PREDICTED: group XV phospholipase A2-like [Bemisia tabaci]
MYILKNKFNYFPLSKFSISFCVVSCVLPTVLSFNFRRGNVSSYDFRTMNMSPVILIPGVVGSIIEGTWRTHGQPRLCTAKEKDWEVLWLSLKTAFGGKPLKCWVFRYKLIYNRTAHKSSNQDGVKTRVMGDFGSLKAVEHLTKDLITRIGTGYFDDIGKALRKSGYSTKRNLKGAAYDGRYAPPQLEEKYGYFTSLAKLVEQLANDSGRKVTLVSHSMGGLIGSHFLTKQPPEWKDKYINLFVPISTPWLGSPLAVSGFIEGTNFDVPTFKKSVMRDLVRTFQSVALLLLSEEAYNRTVIVEWPEQNKTYTAADYKQLFTDIKYQDGFLMREDVRSLMPVAGDKLGVDIVCIWSKSVKTKFKMVVKGDIANPTSVSYETVDGDGTVTLDSLRYCETFPNVTTQEYTGLDHLKIVYSKDFINYLQSVLVNAKPL